MVLISWYGEKKHLPHPLGKGEETEVVPDKTSPQDAREFLRKRHCHRPDLVLIIA